jgi:hypothetical protein
MTEMEHLRGLLMPHAFWIDDCTDFGLCGPGAIHVRITGEPKAYRWEAKQDGREYMRSTDGETYASVGEGKENAMGTLGERLVELIFATSPPARVGLNGE